ncbi:hypothetical protein [Kurthia sp. ISK08]|uniref:hypothetical protein n=1 Tax=Kurthia sp. ISK08 TaxID=3385835 RepID=UPI0038FBEBFE
MQKTIELAYENTVNGGKPFGAIIVKGDDIVAVGVNEVLETHDPTAHVERQAETNDAFALWIEKQQ